MLSCSTDFTANSWSFSLSLRSSRVIIDGHLDPFKKEAIDGGFKVLPHAQTSPVKREIISVLFHVCSSK